MAASKHPHSICSLSCAAFALATVQPASSSPAEAQLGPQPEGAPPRFPGGQPSVRRLQTQGAAAGAAGEGSSSMSYLLPHLHSGFAVDQAILSVRRRRRCALG